MTAGWACAREFLMVVLFSFSRWIVYFLTINLVAYVFLTFFFGAEEFILRNLEFSRLNSHFNSFAFNGFLINLFISKVTLSLSVLPFSWHAFDASTDEKWAVQIVEEAANELKWMVKRRIFMLSSRLIWRRRMNFIILSHISLFPHPAGRLSHSHDKVDTSRIAMCCASPLCACIARRGKLSKHFECIQIEATWQTTREISQ